MSEKQRLKHIADRMPQQLTRATELEAAEPTPDGLGTWEGGTTALKGSNRWVSEKSHASRTGNTKNTPGIDYPTKITHRQDQDFNEIHVEDEKVLLYNVETDAWDIEGDSSDLPFYVDADNLTWAYDYKTGRWDVPVYAEQVEALGTELSDLDPFKGDAGDDIASAIAG